MIAKELAEILLKDPDKKVKFPDLDQGEYFDVGKVELKRERPRSGEWFIALDTED